MRTRIYTTLSIVTPLALLAVMAFPAVNVLASANNNVFQATSPLPVNQSPGGNNVNDIHQVTTGGGDPTGGSGTSGAGFNQNGSGNSGAGFNQNGSGNSGVGFNQNPNASKDIFTLTNPLSDKYNSVGSLVSGFVTIFTYLVILFASLMFVWVGLQFILARGNPTELAERKKQLLWLVVGVAIVISARLIVNVVINTLDASNVVNKDVLQTAKQAANNN